MINLSRFWPTGRCSHVIPSCGPIRPTSEPANSPKVSLLMLNPKNYAHYIAQVIASVLNHRLFQHCELLNGEDSSPEASASICD